LLVLQRIRRNQTLARLAVRGATKQSINPYGKGRVLTPQIDVLMSAYNAGRFLPETLASIQAQTIRDIRIIVVDDGSTDNSAEVLAEAALLDPRIQVIRQANGGIVAALNAGLAISTAAFIARHDADDLSDPDRFKRQIEYLKANPDCVAVAGPARHINEAGRELGTLTRLRDPSRADPFSIPATEPYLLQPMLMVKASSFHAAGGYRPLLIAEDTDLYWRLQKLGRLHNLAEPLGSYRMHDASITSASIESGRRGALYAQLAGISAQRRARNEPDLVFDFALLNAIRQTESLSRLYDIGCRQLTSEEKSWLSLALSAKLIEFCFYRPFEPSVEDCRFIRHSWKSHVCNMTKNDYLLLKEALTATTVRLATKGMITEATLLTPPKQMLTVLLRIVFRIVLPDALRSRVKVLMGR
jgi:glycosyltransferase involved in cell wall biosynthesis